MNYYEYSLRIRVDNNKELIDIISKKLNIKKENIDSFDIIKESIDARLNDVFYNYTFLIKSKSKLNNKNLRQHKNYAMDIKYENLDYKYRPIVVGYGPSGMFLSLYLAKFGLKPIIIERGKDISMREMDIAKFLKEKVLNEDSNFVFGAGGAGTYSDGKLTTNVKSEWNKFILEEFVKHGANPNILYRSNPHIGTDVLKLICKNITKSIKELKGEFYFNTKLIDFNETDDYVDVITSNETFKTNMLILGIGHSAYDTFKLLKNKNIYMEKKPFSVGVRIEHNQNYINNIQYGKYSKFLGAAPYKMAVHLENRSVYTFCMCPGGYVVPSTNYKDHLVINGMSYSKRSGPNANSALLVEIKENDIGKDLFSGFDFIHDLEKKAFNISKDYKAPSMSLFKFLYGIDVTPNIKSSYFQGTIETDLKKIFPDFVIESLKKGIFMMNEKMDGFIHKDAILLAVESRSTCPIRIVRNKDTRKSISSKFIYPIGEGAGYAGGITSSAIDGLKTAKLIVDSIKNGIL